MTNRLTVITTTIAKTPRQQQHNCSVAVAAADMEAMMTARATTEVNAVRETVMKFCGPQRQIEVTNV